LLRPLPTSTLFPYTTLFRSRGHLAVPVADRWPRGQSPEFQSRKVRLTETGPGALEVEYSRQDWLPIADVEQNVMRIQVLVTQAGDRKSTRLNSSHDQISYAV